MGSFGRPWEVLGAIGATSRKKSRHPQTEPRFWTKKGCRKGPPSRFPLALVGSLMAAEGQEVTAGAAAVLARRKDRPPLPRSLREAANEETSDEEWCAAEEQCEEDHETRIFLPASKYGRVRI